MVGNFYGQLGQEFLGREGRSEEEKGVRPVLQQTQ
jgi:hypothetical protein